jgi:PAS domain S-box-containing protein
MNATSTSAPASVQQMTRYPAGTCDMYWSIFEQSGICMANLDPGLRLITANPDFQRRMAGAAREVRGLGFLEFLHPDVRARVRSRFAHLLDGTSPRFSERVTAFDADGKVFGGELTGIGVRDAGGDIVGILVLVNADKGEPGTRPGRGKLLSPVDARILEGVAAGDSTGELAAKLTLSRGGVEYHVTALLRKLKVVNRPALVSKGYSLGILRVGHWPPRVLPQYIE